MLQRYNIFLAQRAKLGKMKKEKILHPSVATGFNDMARLGKRGQKDTRGIKKKYVPSVILSKKHEAGSGLRKPVRAIAAHLFKGGCRTATEGIKFCSSVLLSKIKTPAGIKKKICLFCHSVKKNTKQGVD